MQINNLDTPINLCVIKDFRFTFQKARSGPLIRLGATIENPAGAEVKCTYLYGFCLFRRTIMTWSVHVFNLPEVTIYANPQR